MMSEAELDFSQVKPEVAREVLRLGEVQMQAIQALVVGANQRAATLCGVLTAAAAVTMGGVAAAHAAGKVDLVLAGVLVALMLLAGAAFCVAALWPADFYAPGYAPGDLINRDALFGSLEDTMLNMALLYDGRIRENRRVLIKSSRLFRLGAVAGCGAPVLGGLLLLSLS